MQRSYDGLSNELSASATTGTRTQKKRRSAMSSASQKRLIAQLLAALSLLSQACTFEHHVTTENTDDFRTHGKDKITPNDYAGYAGARSYD